MRGWADTGGQSPSMSTSVNPQFNVASSVKAQVDSLDSINKDSSTLTDLLGTGFWDLAGSASTATPASGMWRTNSSIWPTGIMAPTAHGSPSILLGKAGAWKVSQENLGLLTILCCVTGLLLHR